MILCIAGKNDIAVDVLNYSMTIPEIKEIVVLPNNTDNGHDGWQKSLIKAAKSVKINIVDITDLYKIEDLCFLSLEYNKIIAPERFVSNALFNIHFSALPKYKGMYTSCIPILNGETDSGVTLHEIDRGIDTGDIIDQVLFKIDDNDTAHDLHMKYIKYGTALAKDNLHKLLSNNYTSTKQAAFGASYFSKSYIDFNNVSIDFNKTAYEVKNQIRAFYFPEYQVPVCFGEKICSCDILDRKSVTRAGVSTRTDSCLIVSTIDYDVKLQICK